MLGLHDGTVRRRGHLRVGAVSVRPTALTVVGPGHLLIGTSDGRVVDGGSVGGRLFPGEADLPGGRVGAEQPGGDSLP